MVLDTGSDAPRIAASNQSGERVEPDFRGAAVVYFYPRDDTSGCTTEARQFDDHYDTYAEAGVAVYGVSTDDVDSHREFAEKHDLDFDLLSDPDGKIADAFGVPVEDGHARRTTFVIAKNRVIGVYEGVHPDGHARDVLRDLAEIGLVEGEQ
jgi:peroxiredoxin Q/BCP